MMDYKTLEYKKEDRVGVINFRSYIKDIEYIRYEISEISSSLNEDNDILLAVISNIGNNNSLMDLDKNGFETEAEYDNILQTVVGAIAKIEKPVMAEIDGDVFSSALEIILSCDIRIASENSRFGMSQIETGIIPREGGTQRLPRLVGKGKALEMILTGGTINAQEAYRIGLINRVVSVAELNKTVMDIAKEMASKSPISLRYAKEAINTGMDLTLNQGLHLEADLYMLLHTTSDRTEGIRAFQEKRKPQFEGK